MLVWFLMWMVLCDYLVLMLLGILGVFVIFVLFYLMIVFSLGYGIVVLGYSCE